jgi:hypothetical protein
VKGVATFWLVPALVVPFLAWNQVTTGHLVPISGVLKSSFPKVHFDLSRIPVEYYAMWAIGAAVFAVRACRNRLSALDTVLGILVVGTAGHLLYTLLFTTWSVGFWHFASYLVVGTLGVAYVANYAQLILGRKMVMAGFAALIVAQILALGISLDRMRFRFENASREAAEWIRENTDKDAILAMKDSGAFTYFSDRRVLNLDGVISSFEYQRALCDKRLHEFLSAQNVRYVVQHAVDANLRAALPLPLSGGWLRPATLPKVR